MATVVSVLLILCMMFSICGLPVQTAPFQNNIETIKNRRVKPEELDDSLVPGPNSKGQLRGAAILTRNRWPNGIIPVDLSAITDSNDRGVIIAAMEKLMYDTGTPAPTAGDPTWRKYDCVYFRPRQPTDDTFITVEYGNQCWANIGYYRNYELKMILGKESGNNCFYSSTIQHELMHILGFHHEQNRADRDDYITINFDNVREEEKYNFDKRPSEDLTDLSTGYDYDSIMHYSSTAFSKNGEPTIIPKQTNVNIGYSENLSPTDIAEVRRFYECSAYM